jgi:hypothetical protein
MGEIGPKESELRVDGVLGTLGSSLLPLPQKPVYLAGRRPWEQDSMS